MVTKTNKCPVSIAFTNEGKIKPIWCGSWTCTRCQVINARLWAWRVRIHVANSGGGAFFWTLTLGSGYRTASRGFAVLPSLWDRCRKRMSRGGIRWSYCAFVEGQPRRGFMPHLHIISLSPCPERIKDFAVDCGFGYMAVEEAVTDSKAASYVAKYATKQSPFTPKGFRRVRASRDWAKLPDGKWAALIVRNRSEKRVDYLLRVENKTDVDIDTLNDRYELAVETYELVDYE